MEKLKCFITDDEPFALKGLVNYVEKIDFLELSGTSTNALSLNSWIRENPVDLLFLDIEMPLISGIEFVKSLSNPPMIVFTTAYEKYALEGFELEVLDYLLKPIAFDRFLKSANKAYQFHHRNQPQSKEQAYFFIKVDQKLERIMVNDILHISSMQNYIRIHTVEKDYLTHMTLKNAMQYLDDQYFIQTHKSHIVAIDKIKSIDGNQIIMKHHIIPIAKRLKESVLQKIVNSRLLNGG